MRGSRVAAALAAALCLASPTGTASAAEPEGPVALDDQTTTSDGSAVTVDVLANDTLSGPGALVIVTGAEPRHGAVTVVPIVVGPETRQAFSYAAASGWYGVDTFRYSVTDSSGLSAEATVTVTAPPAPPVAVDDVASVAPGTSVQIPLLDNDSDPYSGPLSIVGVTAPGHGTATITDTGGQVSYTPAVGWSGEDTFTYSVQAASGQTATADVRVTTLPTTPGRTVGLALPGSSPALRPVSVTGAVTPVGAVAPVVTVDVRVGTAWSALARVTPDAYGAFSVAYTPVGVGVVAFRASAQWVDGSVALSDESSVRVVAVVDAAVSGPLSLSDLPWSYRAGCPVAPASLRRLSVNYWDYTGAIRRGDVILVASAVRPVRAVFAAAFVAKFAFKRIVPVDAYYSNGRVSPAQSDVRAMDAGATSAFNCRKVTGNPKRVSQHSYGNAIDLNTYENPYATGSRVYPVAAAHDFYYYRANRLRAVGVIAPGSVVAKAFAVQHWAWGARWARHDYQHFSSNGG
jgi:hypothetical protein